MKRRWLILPLLMLLAGSALADTTNFQEGINYEAVTPPQPTQAKSGQVEVIEFFWYGCPHCFGVEPYLEGWLKTKPKDVVFRRVPAAMPNSEFYTDAQAFFTAQVLGIGDKIHEPFFNAIHLDGNGALRDDVDALRTFFGKFGVAPKDFDATWNSFAVQTRMAEAQQIGNQYNINGVPTFIVNGKWKTGAGYQMTYPDIVKCVQYLVDKEKAAQKKR
jgi:protein dithiol oxidoreductase (disulfide-forming)